MSSGFNKDSKPSSFMMDDLAYSANKAIYMGCSKQAFLDGTKAVYGSNGVLDIASQIYDWCLTHRD